MRKALYFALAMCLGWSLSANAGVISDDDTFGLTAVGTADTAFVDQFNPALGTLQQVTLTLEANTQNGTITWDTTGDTSADVQLGVGAQVTATAPSTLVVVTLPMQTGHNSNVPATDNETPDPAFTGNDSFTVDTGAGSDDDSSSLISGFGPYLGTGQVQIDLTSAFKQSLISIGGSGDTESSAGQYGGTVTIEYVYTETQLVPEPAGLMLLGLAGLAARRRRRK